MKTAEQAAEEYSDKNSYYILDTVDLKTAIEDAFTSGAKWQKEQLSLNHQTSLLSEDTDILYEIAEEIAKTHTFFTEDDCVTNFKDGFVLGSKWQK